jgi:hypothetical protein
MVFKIKLPALNQDNKGNIIIKNLPKAFNSLTNPGEMINVAKNLSLEQYCKNLEFQRQELTKFLICLAWEIDFIGNSVEVKPRVTVSLSDKNIRRIILKNGFADFDKEIIVTEKKAKIERKKNFIIN